jgi:predicted ATPase/DNA-binding SARP family transcriptional activator
MTMARLRVQLLGGFQVERDGVALTAFHSQKAQSLLAYLLVYRDRAHPRSILATLFWGESDEARAHANLRNALYSLRHVLEGPQGRFGQYILTEGGAVRFHPKSSYSLDVAEFEETVESALHTAGEERATLLNTAITLYKGDLLPGFYDDWVVIEQEHLRELYLQALKELVAHYTEHRDYAHAIVWARRVISVSPLQEEMHRALMQLYALTGDRTAALHQYAECEAILQRALNAAPLPETQTLYKKLLRGAPVEAAPKEIPKLPAVPFVGRERELSTLKALWQNVQRGQGQAIFIGGEVGVGKTTFVQKFIESISTPPPAPPRHGEGSSPFPFREGGWGVRSLQGAAYASDSALPYQPLLQAVRAGLKRISDETLAQLPAPWRGELAQFVPELQEKFSDLAPNPRLPPAQGKARWFAALTGFFELLARERPLILFFDDLQWADDATLEYLGHLVGVKNASPLLVIGAYRSEDALEGSRLRAWLDTLGPGRSYHALTLPRLSQEETSSFVEGLLAGAGRELPQQLYHETQGNPLFLTELARALVQSGVLLQDQEDHWQLATKGLSALHWPENLRELIGAALRRAPTRAQRLLEPLAVRACELPVLQGLLHQPIERLLNRLDELRKVGLIVEQEGRYQFHHELARQIVYESLSTDRKKLWHKKIGQALEGLYPERLDELSGELAEHFERAAVPLKAVGYAERAGRHAWRTYAYGTALQFYDRALKLMETTEGPHRLTDFVKLHCLRAEVFDRLGRRDEQKAALQSAARWAAQTSERDVLTIRNLWADFYIAIGSYSQALEEAQTLLKGARALGNRELEARAHQQIGLAYLNQGEYRKALASFEITAQLCQEIGRLDHLGLTLTNMGVAYGYLGEHSRTLDLYQRAYEVAQQTGDRLGQGRALTNLGIVYKKLRNLQRASECSEQAYHIWQEIGDRRAESHTLINLGNLFRTLGELDKAQEHLERACVLSREIKNLQGLAIALHNLGSLHGEQRQEYVEALRYEEEALTVAEQLGLKGLMVHILSNSAIFCARLGQQPEALEQSERAIRLLKETQGTPDPHVIYWNHYELLKSLGQASSDQARAALQTAQETLLQQAQTITDSAQREAFLITPENRQILQAWEAAQREPKLPPPHFSSPLRGEGTA